MKRFVVASAEKIDVTESSVVAVVCTLVLCSVADYQTKKVLQEVKRVLIPVSTLFVSYMQIFDNAAPSQLYLISLLLYLLYDLYT